jgi:hypothetical protein
MFGELTGRRLRPAGAILKRSRMLNGIADVMFSISVQFCVRSSLVVSSGCLSVWGDATSTSNYALAPNKVNAGVASAQSEPSSDGSR